ncbi:MAG: elongation factor P [Berkelbacteria bacterium GW2011_GWA2_35_9]|uniref:Elongation factor P n=1 Tax=Berkelbacteria bacterium GW2011_GWA2_35_9 TaxID=1618333 RepID=A0A0G0DHL8_9BACT|nr:MAG: elongation factor P [Berkelbacteria bacterium GW2011_GWA2_35_9]
MLNIAQLKVGTKFEYKDEPWIVLESNHLKLGRGGGIQQLKIKNLLNGKIVNQNIKGNEKFEEADIQTKNIQFLYTSNDESFFMDCADFEQFIIKTDLIENKLKFIKSEQNVSGVFYQDKLIEINLPDKVTMKVIGAETGLKGDRQSAGTKPVTIETGAIIQAPLFIKKDDLIVINTQNGTYSERKK